MHSNTPHLRVCCLLLATLGLAGGCTSIYHLAKMPATAESDVCRNIAAIPETMKLDIYRDIAAMVTAHLRAGDQHVQQGEFYEALASYKAAYAYDEHLDGLLTKIVALDEKVTRESAKLYEQGRSLLATDKVAALVAFNGAIRLNPVHVEARAAYAQLRADPAIEAKLAELEAQLQQERAAYGARPEELQSLITKNEALLSYDFRNETALHLVTWLAQERERQVGSYLAESDKLFAAGKLERTKVILKKARVMAPDNERIKELQKKVQQRQDSSYLLKLASDRMRQHDPRKAVIYVGRILRLEPKHPGARELLREALKAKLVQPPAQNMPILEQHEFTGVLVTIRELCLAEKDDAVAESLARLLEKVLQREILLMLERGQALFAQQAYVDAQNIFAYVEEVDPGNELAQTFTRKIENRLETLESLQ